MYDWLEKIECLPTVKNMDESIMISPSWPEDRAPGLLLTGIFSLQIKRFHWSSITLDKTNNTHNMHMVFWKLHSLHQRKKRYFQKIVNFLIFFHWQSCFGGSGLLYGSTAIHAKLKIDTWQCVIASAALAGTQQIKSEIHLLRGKIKHALKFNTVCWGRGERSNLKNAQLTLSSCFLPRQSCLRENSRPSEINFSEMGFC